MNSRSSIERQITQIVITRIQYTFQWNFPRRTKIVMGYPYINFDCDDIFVATICHQKALLRVFPEYLLEFRVFCATLGRYDILEKYCEFIHLLEGSFGLQINSTTHISLTEDYILTNNTTLYCVSGNFTYPEVVWSYLHPSGNRTNLTATSYDNSTGLSTLNVYSSQPGYYSCEITDNDRMVETHSVRMLDVTLYTGKLLVFSD